MVKKSILIVDDDPFILSLFSRIFERNGYGTETAEIGRAALAKISNQIYDVALIDVGLPDMVGLELLQSLPSRTKKIVLTSAFSEADQKRAQTEGADAFLLKPVKLEELLALIAA